MNATETYHEIVRTVLNNGKYKPDRTGTGTLSIFDYKATFDLSEGFPLITTKKLHIRSIIHELLWFLKGDTNVKYLNDNGVTIWDEWADDNGDLGPVYGKQWVAWRSLDDRGSINQVESLIQSLKNNPHSRRHLVSAWNVSDLDKMALHPCHWSYEAYVEDLSTDERIEEWRKFNRKSEHYVRDLTENDLNKMNVPTQKLHLKYHQRSVDVGLGLPFNIASYALLTHMIAQQVNMFVGTLVADLTNVHIYSNHIDALNEQLKRDPVKYEQPRLVLSKAEDIFSYSYDDFKIEGYESYPHIKMDVAI